MMDAGFVQMYPLWLLASKDSGGLEWPVPKIGKVSTCNTRKKPKDVYAFVVTTLAAS